MSQVQSLQMVLQQQLLLLLVTAEQLQLAARCMRLQLLRVIPGPR